MISWPVEGRPTGSLGEWIYADTDCILFTPDGLVITDEERYGGITQKELIAHAEVEVPL